jgi:hypothetical protein
MGLPAQVPAAQMSPLVQALASSHGAVLFTCVQPVAGLQASLVHTLPSSQLGGAPPTQTPPEQVSFVVQALPSSQAAVLLLCRQPTMKSQESSVHTLPSSQLGGAPPTQIPPEQVSLVVHALPSLQGAVLLTCVQPEAGLQASSVHTLPSLQLGGAPPTQMPPAQVSLVVQALPSLHESVLLVCVQPDAGLQASSVHTLPSSQLGGAPPTQIPPAQASLVVHALPSSQGAVLLTCVQPVAGLHESSVQTFPSSQLGAVPPMQVPPEQASPVVQESPSSQGPALLVCVQPEAGLQASSVQTLPSSQLGGAPPIQTPPAHVSLVVQGLPSLHGAMLLV